MIETYSVISIEVDAHSEAAVRRQLAQVAGPGAVLAVQQSPFGGRCGPEPPRVPPRPVLLGRPTIGLASRARRNGRRITRQRLVGSHVNVVSTYFYRRVRTAVSLDRRHAWCRGRSAAPTLSRPGSRTRRAVFKLGRRGTACSWPALGVSGRAGCKWSRWCHRTDVINQLWHF